MNKGGGALKNWTVFMDVICVSSHTAFLEILPPRWHHSLKKWKDLSVFYGYV